MRRPNFLSILQFCFTLVLLLTAHPVLAQERGSVSGRVTDKKTGHALPFANIAVVGAQRGALTNSEGAYVVTGVPAGTYEVKVQFLGYKPVSQTGVVVTAGKATVLDFKLEDIVVHEEKAVEVTAERRLVEVKQGNTIRSVSSNDIRNMPVQTVSQVLQQQAGVNTENDQIHVRGGRADETLFMVNGVANRDLVTGQSTAGTLNARSVGEINVATGAFDVRYGNALSGVVEVKLKDGGDHFAGGATITSGTYGARAVQAVVGGPDPVLGAVYHGLGGSGTVSSILDFSGTLYLTRYVTPQPDNFFTGMFDGSRDSEHDGLPRLISSYKDTFFGKTFKYGTFFTPSSDNKWALRYGLAIRPTEKDKILLDFSKRIAVDQGFSRTFINATGDVQDPAYPWIWDHRLANANTIFEDNVQSSAEWRKTLSTQSYTDFQISRYFFAQRTDVQGMKWSDYQQPDDSVYPRDDPRREDYFYDTGDDNIWQDRRSVTWDFMWNMVNRIKRHELEFGLEHQLQTVQYVTIQDPWDADKDGLGRAHDLWSVHPWVGDFYLRDRLEYEGFTANLGLRGDYWFLGREVERALADSTNRNVSQGLRDAFYGDTKSLFGRRYKFHLSPRISVAHPITEHSGFFFNYGEFTQIPSYRYVYSKLTSISSEAYPLLGNPNLNPQVSINYEIGARHQFMPTAAVNVSFYVKDVYDYPTATQFNVASGTTGAPVPIFVYLNGHFARSKGIEVELEKRRSNYWQGKLSYTFEQTKGKSSDPNEQKEVQATGGNAAETPLSESYVSWNRPHKLTASFDVRYDKKPESAPWSWFHQFGLNVFVQGQSGRPYTPLSYNGTATGAPYSKNALFQMTTDMRLNRWFNLGKRRLDLSLSALNLFDNHLIYRVDPRTGLGRAWGDGSYDYTNPHTSAYNGTPTGNSYVYTSDILDPSNYSPGAQWRLQLDYDF